MGSTFLLLLQPTAPQTHRKFFCSLQISLMKKNTKKTKPLLNEDTSKEGLVADIDHILLGPRYTTGSALLQLCALFTAYIRSSSSLAVSSLKVWMAPECYLSIHAARDKVRLPLDCLRHHPSILWECTDSRKC